MTFDQIKTPSNLKAFVENNPKTSHFFDRKTMKFFGDTMKNFGINRLEGGKVELYRKHPVKHGLDSSTVWKASTDGTYAVRSFD